MLLVSFWASQCPSWTAQSAIASSSGHLPTSPHWLPLRYCCLSRCRWRCQQAMEGNLNVVTRQNFRICRRCEQLRRADFRRPNVIPRFFFDTADITQSSRQSLLCIADDTYLGCHRRLVVNYKVRVIVMAVVRCCSQLYKMPTSSHMSVGWLVKIGSAGGRQRRSQSEHAVARHPRTKPGRIMSSITYAQLSHRSILVETSEY